MNIKNGLHLKHAAFSPGTFLSHDLTRCTHITQSSLLEFRETRTVNPYWNSYRNIKGALLAAGNSGLSTMLNSTKKLHEAIKTLHIFLLTCITTPNQELLISVIILPDPLN